MAEESQQIVIVATLKAAFASLKGKLSVGFGDLESYIYPSFALVSLDDDNESDDVELDCGRALKFAPTLRHVADNSSISEIDSTDDSKDESDDMSKASSSFQLPLKVSVSALSLSSLSEGVSIISSALRLLDKWDHFWSSKLHRLELGRGDYLALVPNALTGVVGVPLIAFHYWCFHDSLLYFANMLLITLFNEVLKALFQRRRPRHKALGKKLFNLRSMHNTGAMPSGDAAQAAVAAMFLVKHGYSRLWFAPLTLIGSFGRVYFGAHWIGDCIVGVAYGTVSSHLLINYSQPVLDSIWHAVTS